MDWTAKHDALCDVLDSAFPRRQLFRVEELANLFDCSRDTIDRWMKDKGVVHFTTPGGIRIPRAEVFKLVTY